jgi:hypothetical protein
MGFYIYKLWNPAALQLKWRLWSRHRKCKHGRDGQRGIKNVKIKRIEIYTSKPRNPLWWTPVTRDAGSNHSGDVPNKFFRVFVDDTDTAPVQRDKINDWKTNI